MALQFHALLYMTLMELETSHIAVTMDTTKNLWDKNLQANFLRATDNDGPQDITVFLDIAVDGSRKNIIDQIIEKGFVLSLFGNEKVLTGQFNGETVNIDIQTRGGKVFRIVVFDAIPSDSTKILKRYNNLCRQFASSPRYISLTDNSLPAEEDIEHEISVNGKTYEATYFQKPAERRVGWQTVCEMTMRTISGDLDGLSDEKIRAEFDKTYARNMLEAMAKKTVWFTIVREFSGGYRIAISYENGYNLYIPDI